MRLAGFACLIFLFGVGAANAGTQRPGREKGNCTAIEPGGLRCDRVGNPNASTWPQRDAGAALARSVWDMETATIDSLPSMPARDAGRAGTRLFVGGGEWSRNLGPVTIWSLGWKPARERQPTPGRCEREVETVSEQPVHGEAVELFRNIGGRLYVPDIDPRDPWTNGNLYELNADGWYKHRALEGGVHVFDIVPWQGELVVSAGAIDAKGDGVARLYRAREAAGPWTIVPFDTAAEPSKRFRRMAPYDGGLFVATDDVRSYYWTLGKDGVLVRHKRDLFPDMPADRRTTIGRIEAFEDLILYTPHLFLSAIDPRLRGAYKGLPDLFAQWSAAAGEATATRGLYALDASGEARRIALPQATHVMDIAVEGTTVRLLGARFVGGRYEAAIWESGDLAHWSRTLAVETPALAWSFARMDGDWFLGLGADGYHDVNAQSGAILRIVEGCTSGQRRK